MSKIKIETLSSIHIGDGGRLRNNADYVKGVDAEGSYVIYLIDTAKLAPMIGEANANKWAESVLQGNGFLQEIGSNVDLSRYALREIVNEIDRIGHNNELRSAIHDGFGHPIIPGSSLKGAIRTAIIASEYNGENEEDYDAIRFGRIDNSLFRFLTVSDAAFAPNSTTAFRFKPYNLFKEKDGSPILLETIPERKMSTCVIQLKPELHQWSNEVIKQNPKGTPYPRLPESMKSLDSLFVCINQHTQRLLEREANMGIRNEYKDAVEEMLNEARRCKAGQECVLRVGAGSGWRFVTGSWTREAKKDGKPATRKLSLDKDGCAYLLGFVKLSLENNN